MKHALLLAGAIVLSGCSSLVARQEAQLGASGFRQFPADTPERQALLNKLPARQFVQGRDGDFVTYTYADPQICSCFYVGSVFAYAAYRQLVKERSQGAFQGAPAYVSPPPPGFVGIR